jgi:protein transport protein HofC
MILLWSAFWVWTVCQTSRRESLLQLLELAAERQLPLGPALRALADSYRGRFRARIFALAEMLDQGVSLPDALDRLPELTDPPTRVVARVGWESGVLQQALVHSQTGLALRARLWYGLAVRLGYPVLLVFYCQGVIWFLIFWIAPKFQKLLEDFDMALPGLTQWAIDTADVLVDTGVMAAFSLWIALVVLVVLVYVFLLLIGYEPVTRRGLMQWLVSSDLCTLLRSLALGVESGRPIGGVVRGLAASWPHRRLRRKLEDTDAAIRSGAGWTEALRDSGLVRRQEVALLESAQRADNLAWALRAVAERNERRTAYWLELVVQLTSPLVLVAVGAVIGIIVVAYFLPLITILQESALHG